MDHDFKCFVVLMLTIIVVVASIVFGITYYQTEVVKSAIQAGLVQDTLPGETGVFWVKPRE